MSENGDVSGNGKMRAVVARGYGGPKVLRLEEVARPRPGRGEVLVEVRAAGVNPVDWRLRRGEMRLLTGLKRTRILGRDVAGVVATTGEGVEGFRAGDKVDAMLGGVFGGGYAEYVAVEAGAVAPMPEKLSFEEAAGVPLAALTALRAVREALREVKENAPHACDAGALERRRVLINGASGGVGTFAVQLAKIFGAEVTAVCGARNAGFVREIGAACVIDYDEEDFASGGETYDVIFDVVANRSYRACKRVLRPGGVYVTTEPGPRQFASQVLTMPNDRKARVVLAKPSGDDLSMLGTLLDAGRLRVVLDRVYPLEEAAEAHAHGEAGHGNGKTVLSVRR
ncbi:MAG: NAD(P)-dependent alcohol dehydrogenase [Rubrobacteraceae bacterium]